MARRKEKQPVHHMQMTERKRAVIQQLLQEYDIESAQDIQDALKDLLSGIIKEMMEAQMVTLDVRSPKGSTILNRQIIVTGTKKAGQFELRLHDN